MNSDDSLSNLLYPIPKCKRAYTMNVNAETFEIIARVADQLGQSRPHVLAAFVLSSYQKFLKEAKVAGLEFDPNAPLPEATHQKGRPKSKAKKKIKTEL